MGVVCKPTKSMLIAVAEEVDEVTFRVTLVECVSEPLVPEMVNVGLPIGVLPLVVIVSVEDPDPVIDAGENDGVAPLGSPAVTLRFTRLLNPFNVPTLTK